ncbi:Olfactory receptor 51G1 [Camelus dromedarius]|uniref:Olfactory receptor 51G1 n=1 Tax=Camelus dromedarius TaxID=9838 RepID=A0A5N4DLJ5_CAMDR|nr:Olfactory receptor 51G1 [Camelus dromedarius]
MYYFLSLLSFSDVAMSMATLPTVLRTFCLNARNIDFPPEEQSLHQPMYYFLSRCLSMTWVCPFLYVAYDTGYFVLSCTKTAFDACLTQLSALLLSYALILPSVLAIASQEERLKTFNTCVSHICAVLIFYVPMASLLDGVNLLYVDLELAIGVAWL